ncbi:Fe-only nitrogenase accessory AnfO family protein [Sporolactobacillus inulinus]|uniref:Fe-only nitrogenase accessory protein AnfO n=1 Tax=Sporolactobacillus inulinus CASD TaxID=1069536 RepID=A0A0U1QRQ1_9BACL|nr:Fe-only nitrogenase accessory AnfO family protein [Sporolactobacillus inulinus]KLI03491.1 hypothetical protein SINU_02365 [Sporolactobacillus inulinus CASD]GEB77796.1 hypothetical protein SIN01_21410 [Sporolactobacillus inulinus]
MAKLVVFSSENGLCPFKMADQLIVYEKIEKRWVINRKIKMNNQQPRSIRAQRKYVEELLPLIYDCKILVGKEISGIPYVVFDKAGFHVFQVNQLSDEQFEAIIREIHSIESDNAVKKEILKKAVPVPTENKDVYFLDLVKLQKRFPEVTSKQALKPFISQTPFLELHLYCKHTPPWIERDGRYIVESKPAKSDQYIVIKAKPNHK